MNILNQYCPSLAYWTSWINQWKRRSCLLKLENQQLCDLSGPIVCEVNTMILICILASRLPCQLFVLICLSCGINNDLLTCLSRVIEFDCTSPISCRAFVLAYKTAIINGTKIEFEANDQKTMGELYQLLYVD